MTGEMIEQHFEDHEELADREERRSKGLPPPLSKYDQYLFDQIPGESGHYWSEVQDEVFRRDPNTKGWRNNNSTISELRVSHSSF